jgi:hypothetical protein
MPKVRTRPSDGTSTAATDPVVDLSCQLLDLWNADGASEVEYHSSNKTLGRVIQQQFGEWQQAVAQLISFTQATSLAGALVQMAIALDELDSLRSTNVDDTGDRQVRQLSGVDEDRVYRLIRSTIRVLAKSPEVEAVRPLLDIYGGGDHSVTWLDNMERWAQEGVRIRSEVRKIPESSGARRSRRLAQQRSRRGNSAAFSLRLVVVTPP